VRCSSRMASRSEVLLFIFDCVAAVAAKVEEILPAADRLLAIVAVLRLRTAVLLVGQVADGHGVHLLAQLPPC